MHALLLDTGTNPCYGKRIWNKEHEHGLLIWFVNATALTWHLWRQASANHMRATYTSAVWCICVCLLRQGVVITSYQPEIIGPEISKTIVQKAHKQSEKWIVVVGMLYKRLMQWRILYRQTKKIGRKKKAPNLTFGTNLNQAIKFYIDYRRI